MMASEDQRHIIVLSDDAVRIMNTPASFAVVEDIYSISSKRAWVVVATGSNAETKVAKNLDDKKIAGFLPTELEVKKVVHERQYVVRGVAQKTRPKTERQFIERPLMPGYLFAQLPVGSGGAGFTNEGLSRLLHVDGVRAVLGSTDGPISVPDIIVERLRETQGKRITKPNAAEANAWIQKGTEVRITEGPFASLNATIQRLRDDEVVDAFVEILGRMSRIQLSVDQIEKAC